jgi:hypothetical protein
MDQARTEAGRYGRLAAELGRVELAGRLAGKNRSGAF